MSNGSPPRYLPDSPASIRALHRLARLDVLTPVPQTGDRIWSAWCPSCQTEDRTVRRLRVEVAGLVAKVWTPLDEPVIDCGGGCTAEAVLSALDHTIGVSQAAVPHDLRSKITSQTELLTAARSNATKWSHAGRDTGPRFAEAAERYVTELGWPVFPIVPGAKNPLTEQGFHDASTDLGQIRHWWQVHPGANIGIPTGTGTFDVLDVDNRPSGSGWAARDRLRDAGLLRGAFALVCTPSGGAHLYFAGSGQRNGSLRGLHVDFRATGGYVLVPPSVIDGKPYEWVKVPETGSDVATTSLDWSACVRLLNPPKPNRSRVGTSPAGSASTVIAWLSRQHEGDLRNCGLFWAANRLIEHGDADKLDELGAVAVEIGLTSGEVRHTIDSALRTSGGAA